jgi:polyhydroxyalkanoate synthase
VLVIPSLINRAYVLDLDAGARCCAGLARAGCGRRSSTGAPGPEEARFSLDDYGARRLSPPSTRSGGRAAARGAAGLLHGRRPRRGPRAPRPEGLTALATIGHPWDFASPEGLAGGLRAALRAEGPERAARALDALGEAFGLIPVQTFQALFALVNPMQAAVKFRNFARLDPDGPAARRFVALEDWLADGVPMAASAARTLLIDWLIRNLTPPGAGSFWGDRSIPRRSASRARRLRARDAIAPPALTRPLAAAIPGPC